MRKVTCGSYRLVDDAATIGPQAPRIALARTDFCHTPGAFFGGHMSTEAQFYYSISVRYGYVGIRPLAMPVTKVPAAGDGEAYTVQARAWGAVPDIERVASALCQHPRGMPNGVWTNARILEFRLIKNVSG